MAGIFAVGGSVAGALGVAGAAYAFHAYIGPVYNANKKRFFALFALVYLVLVLIMYYDVHYAMDITWVAMALLTVIVLHAYIWFRAEAAAAAATEKTSPDFTCSEYANKLRSDYELLSATDRENASPAEYIGRITGPYSYEANRKRWSDLVNRPTIAGATKDCASEVEAMARKLGVEEPG